MTTIAWDGKALAADSRTIGGYITPLETQKIFKVGGSYIGIAGQLQQAQIFIRWYRDQTKPKPDPKTLDDFEALVIKDGKAYEYCDLCEPVEIGKPAAIGTGAQFAMGAMAAGLDARKAVQVAAKFDENTGGKVKVVKIK